jgi:steroid delta-isomerase-like uncharacterized protein
MNEDIRTRARRGYEMIASGDIDGLHEVVAQDMVDRDPVPGQKPGLEGVKEFFHSMRAGMSDLKFDLEDLIVEGDKAVARIRLRGKHTGEFMGIPATGRDVDVQGIDILRFENGKVVERRGIFEDLNLLQQLGVIPPMD